MARKLTKKYSKLLNKQLWNWSVILLLVATIIVSVWSILHIKPEEALAEGKNSWEVISINWKSYRLIR
jgi:hypothetical protein